MFYRWNSVIFRVIYWFWIISWLQMTSLSWKLSAAKNYQNILSSHKNVCRCFFIFLPSFSKDQFCCGMGKQRNFLHVVDLLFDASFVRYDQFSLHYHKQFPQLVSQMIGNWLIYTGFKRSPILWFKQTCHLANFTAK